LFCWTEEYMGVQLIDSLLVAAPFSPSQQREKGTVFSLLPGSTSNHLNLL
jgi:hypothetical protein